MNANLCFRTTRRERTGCFINAIDSLIIPLENERQILLRGADLVRIDIHVHAILCEGAYLFQACLSQPKAGSPGELNLRRQRANKQIVQGLGVAIPRKR